MHLTDHAGRRDVASVTFGTRGTRGLILGRGFVPEPSSFAVKSLGLGVRELKIQSLGFGVREQKKL